MTSDINKWRDLMRNLRQMSVLLTFKYVKRVKIGIGICDKQIITPRFGYRPQYQPLTIISPRAKALGLIMGSRVDTSGNNQNDVR